MVKGTPLVHKIQVAIIFLGLPVAAFFFYLQEKDISISELYSIGAPVLHIGDLPVRVEIADSPEERQKGLSGRENFDTATGLFFVFDTTDYHGIWMKDMFFPIDIIWISEDLAVVGIEKNVSPETYPKTFRPPTKVRYVLETNARYTDTFGVQVGQKVTLPMDMRE